MKLVLEPLSQDLHEIFEEKAAEERRRQTEHDAMVKVLMPLVRQVFGFGRPGNRHFVGSFNIEEFWSENSDYPNLRSLYVSCPDCRRRIAPFQSRSVIGIDGGWRWVGLDHQEPYSDYFAACGWCGAGLLFTVYVPQ